MNRYSVHYDTNHGCMSRWFDTQDGLDKFVRRLRCEATIKYGPRTIGRVEPNPEHGSRSKWVWWYEAKPQE